MNFSTNDSDEQELTIDSVELLINSGDRHQNEGDYQAATKDYLQALETVYQIIPNHPQDLQSIFRLAGVRAMILSRLGDNLIYVGQYKIAAEFYDRQLRIVADIGSKFDLAFARHKVGFGYYFMGMYEDSIQFQQQSLKILADEEEELYFQPLRCKIHLCFGLNHRALKNYEIAANNYEEALSIARNYELQQEESEIIANLSAAIREKLELEHENINTQLDELIGDLHHAIRIAKNNPYVKALALNEIAKVFEINDINLAENYFEQALDIARMYDFSFLKDFQSNLNSVIQKRQELIEQDYILEEQPWYCHDFPKIPEVEEGNLKSLVSAFKAEFVIVTATPIELKAVVRLLEPDSSLAMILPCRLHSQNGQYYLGKFGRYKAVVTQCRMSARDDRSANGVTRSALKIWNPKAVIMIGIAFGKSSIEQNIADVLVAKEIIDYEVTKIGVDGITDRGSRTPSSSSLLGLFEQAYEWQFSRPDGSLCKLIPAPILSGDKLVNNPEFKADLFSRYPQAQGGEMEGVGFCFAANSLQKPWVLVKSICDWADGKKNDKHQPLAAAAAVSLVHYVLSQKTILNSLK